MKSNILKEVNEIRQMMGLNEQGVVDAVTSGVETGSKFSNDDEYMLLGMINSFLSNKKSNIDPINKSWDENAEWISKYRAPVGRFGKILFDYLNNDGEKYNENDFKIFLDIFNSPNIYDGNKPKNEEFIELGKSITDFQYNN
jgi:hypothetical protein